MPTAVLGDIEKQDYHIFKHRAMATEFEIYLKHERENYALQAATEAFLEIDRLEKVLSRFIENSDVSRINNLNQLESTTIGLDCFECLEKCSDIYQITKGAFDVSAGELIKLWKQPAGDKVPDQQLINRLLKNTGMPWILLNKEAVSVQLSGEKINVDLGGFGKGYALDVVGNLLTDWGIEAGLLNAGMSTVKPFGESYWHLQMHHPVDVNKVLKVVHLKDLALSSSGVRKGQHIIDPRNGYPVEDKSAVWVTADEASMSDALSTAFMIMSLEEIEEFCNKYRNISAMILMQDSPQVITFGDFFNT